MKRFLFLFFVLFRLQLVFAQASFEDGYIINNTGDTIRGKIKDRKYVTSEANSDKIRFIDASGKERKIKPDKAKGYGRRGNVHYRALPVGREAKLQFVKIIEYGNVILFGYATSAILGTTMAAVAPTSSKDKHVEERIDIDYFYQRSKDPNSLMKVKRDKFESVSLFYFKDDAELIKKIEDKSLKYEDIRKVVQMYNEFKGGANK
jgi:hypothetical protein